VAGLPLVIYRPGGDIMIHGMMNGLGASTVSRLSISWKIMAEILALSLRKQALALTIRVNDAIAISPTVEVPRRKVLYSPP
jgi:hypothetical protein